jgi:hypothetical protein
VNAPTAPPPPVDNHGNAAPPVRKIIQIACADGALYVLADDSTIWCNYHNSQPWVRVDVAAICNGAA